MANFSYLQGLSDHDHTYLDFADVHIGKDNRLFIDPSRIRLAALDGDSWAIKADRLINSYFNCLCNAARTLDYPSIRILIQDTCGEHNETQLGWSQGTPAGTGASFDLIWPAINYLITNGYFDEGLVTGLEDIPIWADGIDADRISDWITNIIWPVLHEFTVYQYTKYGLPLENESYTCVPTWNINSGFWESHEYPNLFCDGVSILLCPKKFLHKQLLMNAEDFLRKVVLEYRQREHLDQQSNLCYTRTFRNGSQVLMPPTKNDLMKSEVKGSPHSAYTSKYAQGNPSLFKDYHSRYELRPGNSSNYISDKELNQLLYGKSSTC